MCYVVTFSTTDPLDFSTLNSSEMRFERAVHEPGSEWLRHPHHWVLVSRYGGCSCHYRHLHTSAVELGFGPPADWMEEDEEDIESTRAAYGVFAGVLSRGYSIDLVDLWTDHQGEPPTVVVDLSQVTEDDFRFFEGHRFEFVNSV